MRNTRIAGTGSSLPKKILTNKDLEKIVETEDSWIVDRTGIKQRHIVTDETNLSLSLEASKQAMAMAGVSGDDLDMIIVATTTPDKLFPSTACYLQSALGCRQIGAFDIQAACAGFVYALSIADQFVKSGQAKHVLVVGSDVLSRIVDWTDRGTCILFGDGAGAAVLSATEKPGIIETALHTNGDWAPLLFVESLQAQPANDLMATNRFIQMAGNKVFKIAVTKLGEMVADSLERQGYKTSDLDWLVPHQANLRIIKATAERLDCPMSKVVCTVQDHGNTSAASIPLALDVAVRDGRIQRDQLILLESFGGGLAWGSALIRF